MRKHRRFVLGAAVLALALTAAACGSGGDDSGEDPNNDDAGEGQTAITIGVSGAFAENQVVAEMYAQVLEQNGYDVTRELDIESRDVGNTALESGDIDLKPEYTGPELLAFDETGDASGTPGEVAQRLANAAADKGLDIYDISPANSTNVFVSTPEVISQNNLSNLSSLAGPAADLSLGAPPDCPTNPFCAPGLKKVYGVEFADIRKLDFGGPKTVAALKSGAVQVGVLFSLDPTIGDEGLVILPDDKQMVAVGNFVPIVRQDVSSPALQALLDPVTTSLTDEDMVSMVDRIQNDHEDVEDVASDYLAEKSLVS